MAKVPTVGINPGRTRARDRLGMRGLRLARSDRLRVEGAVRRFAGDDLQDAALWRETNKERKRYPVAYVSRTGIHFDSRLFKVLTDLEDDYLAFITLHELSHIARGHLGGHGISGEELQEEVFASADAAEALTNYGVIPKSRAEMLMHRWWKDFLHPETSDLFHGLEIRRKTRQ